jgi:hypothetical protein
VNNDGAKHRAAFGRGDPRAGGKDFYRHLKAAGFPNDPPLQVLCANCNFGKSLRGVCPHALTD